MPRKGLRAFFRVLFLVTAMCILAGHAPSYGSYVYADSEIMADADPSPAVTVPEPTPTPSPASPKKTAAKTGKWVKKDGYCYYYTGKKKKLGKGIQTIGKRQYCFDAKGRQLTGWRKVGKDYYFFRCKNGRGGYMVTRQKVDGISLKANGKAVPKDSRAKEKLPLLIRIQKVADSLVKPLTDPSKKLRVCYDYITHRFHNILIGGIDLTRGNWDLKYMAFMLDHGGGDCVSYAATFAYLANAIGYKNVRIVNNGAHAWAEIGDRFYDPHWEQGLHVDCYAAPASLSGTGGRPHWVGRRFHILRCDK